MQRLQLLFGVLIAASLSIFTMVSPAFAWDLKDMNRAIDQTNFLINQGCSGTLIDAVNGYILTAAHCVDSQYETVEREVIKDDGEVKKDKVRRLKEGEAEQLVFAGASQVSSVSYRIKLKAVSKDRDLALVQIVAKLPGAENIKAAELSCDAPLRGEKILIVGNPQAVNYSSVVAGIVSSNQRTYSTIKFGDGSQDTQPLMQISGGVIGGNSGGAVYNDNGKLVGVPVLANRMNEVIAFAVPLDVIRSFLTENKVTIQTCVTVSP